MRSDVLVEYMNVDAPWLTLSRTLVIEAVIRGRKLGVSDKIARIYVLFPALQHRVSFGYMRLGSHLLLQKL